MEIEADVSDNQDNTTSIEMRELEEKAAVLTTYCDQSKWNAYHFAEVIKDLQSKVTSEQIEPLYLLGKSKFQCQHYRSASKYLEIYRWLCPDEFTSWDSGWQKIASDIMLQRWNVAYEEIKFLKETFIDPEPRGGFEMQSWLSWWKRWIKTILNKQKFPFRLPHNQPESRLSLLHWSLFVFLTLQRAKKKLINLFCQDRYLEVIQTDAPHLLRYLGIAFVFDKSTSAEFVKFRTRVLEKNLSDQEPVCEFLACIYVYKDMAAARAKLGECAKVIFSDPFLGKRVGDGHSSTISFSVEFLKRASSVISKAHCGMLKFFDSTIANKVRLVQEADECIVELQEESGKGLCDLSDDLLRSIMSRLQPKERALMQAVSRRFDKVGSSFEWDTVAASFHYHASSVLMLSRISRLMETGETVLSTLERLRGTEDDMLPENEAIFGYIIDYCGILCLRKPQRNLLKRTKEDLQEEVRCSPESMYNNGWD